MAGLFLGMMALPTGYVLANAASLVEGKGLRLLGGLLDVGLLGVSVAALLIVEEPAYAAAMAKTAEERYKRTKAQKMADTALGVAAVAANYAAAKYLIGSPTSTASNLVVGSLFAGYPAYIMS